MYRLIIAGSRDFSDYNRFEFWVNHYISRLGEVHIISGGARGPDTMAITYAELNDLPFTIYKAEWDKYGKSAGYRRNEEMAKNADMLLAFWDGKSNGTGHMINLASQYGLAIRVVNTVRSLDDRKFSNTERGDNEELASS